MRRKTICVVCLFMCFAIGASGAGKPRGADPLSGTWTGDWGPSASDRNQVTVELKWDGKALTGNVTGGTNVSSAIPLQKSTFDPKTGTVHMEADARGRGGATIHYVIDGKVDRGSMTGSWNHDNRKGDFKIAKK